MLYLSTPSSSESIKSCQTKMACNVYREHFNKESSVSYIVSIYHRAYVLQAMLYLSTLNTSQSQIFQLLENTYNCWKYHLLTHSNLAYRLFKLRPLLTCRWGNTKVRMSWAGQHIEAVRIDTYGKFVFILAKVSDRTSAHRLLVRGRNGADKSALIRALTVEVRRRNYSQIFHFQMIQMRPHYCFTCGEFARNQVAKMVADVSISTLVMTRQRCLLEQ